MAYTYDLGTDVGKARMLIPDRPANGATWASDDAHLFTDAEIEAFLVMESGYRRAAALALETIASDNAMVSKVIRLLDRATDGANASRALRERAALLRAQADQADATDDDTPGFDWAEQVVNDFGYRARMNAEALRDG